jgi:hypothetical protein
MSSLFTYHERDTELVRAFLSEWLSGLDGKWLLALVMDEFPGIDLRVDGAIERLRKEGPVQSIKRILQGDLFYMGELVGSCARCRRHVPEVAWETERGSKDPLCNRCVDAVSGGVV